ncbi:hypothetical protein [Mycobacterium vicinigordonae]|uniref:NlpC/P60 domain-containing protein n=1 Tax=Mycobacterium vicinigordonae TaxID=1719132 RepID=A0A7D6HSE8_9MYCO|nr:hypothetical protein [Mycobacterium vicinigordonae]QLL08771.1 hypothetical protein H0P51_07625 [Mycobacterium vicinigordonae]
MSLGQIPGYRVGAGWLGALLAVSVLATGCTHPKQSHAVPAATVAAPESGAAALASEVQRELNSMRVTRYQHTTAVEESSGQFFYDCSGLVDYALERATPADLQPIPHQKARPLAADIESYLQRGLGGPIQGWQPLSRVDALRAGDVVAWLATEDSTTGDTGHVMVVLAAPAQNSARRRRMAGARG